MTEGIRNRWVDSALRDDARWLIVTNGNGWSNTRDARWFTMGEYWECLRWVDDLLDATWNQASLVQICDLKADKTYTNEHPLHLDSLEAGVQALRDFPKEGTTEVQVRDG